MAERTRTRRAIERVVGLGLAGVFVFAGGVVVGGLIVFGWHQAHRSEDGPKATPAAFSEVAEPLAGQLAEDFRPWLEFDSGEPWRPLDVSALLAEGRHRFCSRGAGELVCRRIRSALQFDTLVKPVAGDAAEAVGAGSFLDLAGTKLADYRGPERCAQQGLADCGMGARSTIYYHATESNDRFYLDYWWFLRFNHFSRLHANRSCGVAAARRSGACDEHEGDWEGVTVVTPPDDPEHVDYVVYAAHKGTFRYAASGLRFVHDRHPVVDVAQGSHASYPARCAHDCVQPSGLAVDGLVDLPEGDTGGQRPWARNGDSCMPKAPDSCLKSLAQQPWTTWPGLWGAGCGDACGGSTGASSPRSPGLQTRYQAPSCSVQGGAFTCDSRALRCADWLGPQVMLVACNPAVLSQSQRTSDAVETGRLALIVGGSERTEETTPGVVQALGRPLRPGQTEIVVADGSATQVLVRAEQGGVVAEDRFAGLGAAAGQRLVVRVSAGADAPSVLVDDQAPVERRFVSSGSAG